MSVTGLTTMVSGTISLLGGAGGNADGTVGNGGVGGEADFDSTGAVSMNASGFTVTGGTGGAWVPTPLATVAMGAWHPFLPIACLWLAGPPWLLTAARANTATA